MRFRKKKKDEYVDPTTKRLLEQGVIKVRTPEDYKGEKSATQILKEFGMVTYDFWSGVKFTIVLSALLWWLPLFGPMLAGYVGGRRTGGPKKGVLAAITGLIVIAVFHFAFTHALFPSSVTATLNYPNMIVAAAYQSQAIAPYARFMELYWGSFFTSILGGLPYSPNSYIITIIFAYVGGVISVDKVRELDRSLDDENPSVTINLAQIRPDLRSFSSRNDGAGDQRRLYSGKTAPSGWGSNANYNGQKRLQDLKRVQFHSEPKRSSEKKSKKDKKKKSSSWKPSLPKRSVTHHSSSEGSDWEIL
ncbi:MAG: hypothetical protein R6U61_08460 [Thermoplasmata archaeon]